MFSTVHLPVTTGVRTDVSDLASAQDSLVQALNADFSIAGQVMPREDEVSVSDPMVSFVRDNPAWRLTGIETMADSRQVIGCASHKGEPLFHTTGALYQRKAGTVYGVGPHWSVNEHTSSAVGGSQPVRTEAVNAGLAGVGYTGQLPLCHYMGYEGVFPIHSATATDPVTSSCAAGNFFFVATGTSIKMHSGFPSTTTVTLATDFAGGARGLWAVQTGGGEMVVAYVRATSTRLLRLSSSGTVLSSTSLTSGILGSGTSLLCLSLGYNTDTGTLALVACGGVAVPTTDVVQMDAIALVPALVESHAESARDCAVGCLASLPAAERWRVVLQESVGTVGVFSFAELDPGTFYQTAQLPEMERGVAVTHDAWSILFPPTQIGDRLVFGVLNFQAQTQSPGQFVPYHLATWLVLDTADLAPVASGEEGSCAVTTQGSAVLSDGLRFGVFEGDVYQDGVITRGRAVAKQLQPQACATTTVNNVTYFSGQLPYLFDGYRTLPVNFPIRPVIHATGASGGSIPTGSYSLQVCWSITDGQGNVYRSAPSNKMTVSSSGSVTVSATLPYWLFLLAGKSRVVAELYMTEVNPSVNAGLFLVATQTPTLYAPMTFSLTSLPSFAIPSLPPLYTNGGIMENNRPMASRGLVASGSRVWCSDGKRIMASKYVRSGEGVAWSYAADDSLVLSPPPSAGDVLAISAVDDVVVALCESSVVILGGAGPADVGGPSDFAVPREVYRISGPATPAGVCAIPASVVWSSRDGGVHLLNAGGQGSSIGQGIGGKHGRVVYLPSVTDKATGKPQAPRLFALATAGLVDVMLLSTGAWSTYAFDGVLLDAAVAEVGGDPTLFYSREETGGTLCYLDSSIRTMAFSLRTHLRQLGSGGRLRSIAPEGKAADGGYLLLRVYADQEQLTLTNSKEWTLAAPGTNYPRTNLPKWVLPRPHMEAFAIRLLTTATLTGLSVELQSTLAEVRKER